MTWAINYQLMIPGRLPLADAAGARLAEIVRPIASALEGSEWYTVTGPNGLEIGRIRWPDRRPVLGRGAPTFLLQRARQV